MEIIENPEKKIVIVEEKEIVIKKEQKQGYAEDRKIIVYSWPDPLYWRLIGSRWLWWEIINTRRRRRILKG